MSRSSAAHRAPVDLRAPLVLDLRDLGRRAGSMREVRRTIPAPADWGLELVAVPAGSEVDLDLRLEAVMDGVLVSGTITAATTAECGRCLEPVSTGLVIDVQELFLYEPDPEDDEIPTVAGEAIDFASATRDAVLLALPLNPLCRADCAGLCTGCGARVADLPPDHGHDATDPRWAALGRLVADRSTESDTETTPKMRS